MLSISNDGAVTVVRIEHGKVNALDLELLQAITEVFRTRRDEVIVLTGSGSALSASPNCSSASRSRVRPWRSSGTSSVRPRSTTC